MRSAYRALLASFVASHLSVASRRQPPAAVLPFPGCGGLLAQRRMPISQKRIFRLAAPQDTTIYVRPGYNRVLAEEFEALKAKRVDLRNPTPTELARLQASLSRYQSTENNNPVATGGSAGLITGLGIAINEVIDANVIGDQSSAGKNRRGFPNIPQAYNDRRDRESEGYEFETVANLSSRWRLLANVATPRAYQSNAYTDTRAYLQENDAILRQILGDGGVKIDANNSAYVDPAVPINQRTPDAAAAALAWNNLQAILNSFLTGSQRITRLVETTANLFTDYRFAEGWLRGVRLGGGCNYRGREIIGYRGADTIVNPTNTRLAVDDPNASPVDPVYRKPYTLAIASLGYERRLGRSLRLSLDLKVEDLFNVDPVLYYNTALRPPGGDLTTPARVAKPYQFSLLAPRNSTLTATLRF